MFRFLKLIFSPLISIIRRITCFFFPSSNPQPDHIHAAPQQDAPSAQAAPSDYDRLLKQFKYIDGLLESRHTNIQQLEKQLQGLIASGQQRQARNKQDEIRRRKDEVLALSHRHRLLEKLVENAKTPSRLYREQQEYERLERELAAEKMHQTVGQNPTLNMFSRQRKLRKMNSTPEDVADFLHH